MAIPSPRILSESNMRVMLRGSEAFWTFPLVPKDKILRPVAQNDRLYGVILNAREGFFKI